MGSFENFARLCRLCGLESYHLISLFEGDDRQPRLTALIKKYLKVTVSIQDSLPHQVCGPCIAKLDEVVDFVEASHAMQSKLKSHLKELQEDRKSTQENEDKYHKLVQDVKVEPEESDSPFIDDPNDEDYSPHTSKQQRWKTARRLRRPVMAFRGPSNRLPKKVKSKETVEGLNCVKEREAENTMPSNSPIKAEEWVLSNHLIISAKSHSANNSTCPKDLQENFMRKEVEETPVDDSTNNSLSTSDKLGNTVKWVVRCSLCKSPFSHFEHLAAHSKEAHQLSEPSYMCPQCPIVCSKVVSLRTHQRRKHQDSQQTCPHCNKLYPAHYLWTRHMLVHTNSRPFSCDECDKKFKSRAEMFNHKKTHQPSEERYTHCCEVCGKRFTQKANLDSHLRLHTGSRPFSCEFCGKCFSQRGNMEEHRRIHTGEKPFVCDVCGVRYPRQGQLAMHRRQHLGEKPHKCQYCGKEFLRKEVLKKHENMHTDTRPYKCSYCEKSFRDQGKRKVHERLHTGERPFECEFCGRGFCESGNLRKHLRVHQRRPDSVASPTRRRDHGSFPAESRHTGAPDRGSSFHCNSVPNSTFHATGLAASRHSTNIAGVGNSTGTSTTVVIAESVALAPASSHSVTQAHEPTDPSPPSLPLLGSIPSHNPSLATLHQVEDSQGNTTLPPQGCEREEYRVASSYQPPATWTVYHA